MDGEESTSKEVKRSAFDIESITEQRFTPGTHNEAALSQNQHRYTQPNVNVSMEESSTSGGQRARPNALQKILDEEKKEAAQKA